MIKINLLPKERRRGRGIQISKPMFIVLPAVVLVVAAMLVGWWYLDSQVQLLQQEVTRSRAELKKYESDIKKVEQFRADKRRLEERVKIVQRLAAEQEGPVHLLDQVSRSLPEEVWLTGLTKARDKLTLQGYAFSNFGIANFMTELGKSRPLSIKRVELSFSEKAAVERVPVERFEITAEVGN
jgi:type IV pilus assembly protein PilN